MIQPAQSGVSLTCAELLALPAVIDVVTAGRALGLGRTKAYELARQGRFPCRVLRIGDAYRVPTSDLWRLLGIEPPATTPAANSLAADEPLPPAEQGTDT